MRVLALVPYPLDTAPGQRYRIEQWVPYLREQGIEVVFCPFLLPGLSDVLYERDHYAAKVGSLIRALHARVRHAWTAAQFDAVLVYREACLVGPAWAEALARFRRPALVYDFDDAVWLHYVSPSHGRLSYLKFPGKTRRLCRMASAVMVGNAHLAEFASRYNQNVHIVPSTVSLRSYRPRTGRREGQVPVVGWTGSHSSAPYLKSVVGALSRLHRRRAFRVLVIGVERAELPDVETEYRPWRAATEVEDLWDMDVGIMPLPDEPWARGKCGMKVIQYMGVGLPAVVSPVGANTTIVQDGVTGFLPRTEDDWVQALDRLLGDERLRLEMGRAARRRVEERYSAEAQAPVVATIFRSLAG